MSYLSNFTYSKPMQTTVTLTDTQLVSEELADECGEIIDIIEAERIN